MPDYFGYPQHPDAWARYPWWRWTVDGLRRTDGLLSYAPSSADMPDDERHARDVQAMDRAEEHDRKHPLPPPPPMCGQVWVWPEGDAETIISTCRGWWTTFRTRPGLFNPGAATSRESWPPPGAVLVAGPGSPWAPMGCHDA
jgi:hypothetical protein